MGYLWENEVELDHLVGKTIERVEGLEKDSEIVRIFTECGNEYLFYHDQDCCEEVRLNDFDGYPGDLIGALIVSVEEVASEDEGEAPGEYSESWTWTFYKIETNKGGIWMRWLGESNGYYSEKVNFAWVNKPS